MAFLKIHNVAIRGISACVPKNVEENKDLPFYELGEAEQVIEKIGIERRHVASLMQTAMDLCLKAAEKLIEELHWEKESIDALAFITQTPDYINQPNSFLVHEQLGLSEQTLCLDYYHGCPGWVVGLSSVGSMLMTGSIHRALILDGDTMCKYLYAHDRESRPLFGDAGTATALEFDEKAAPIFFNFGTLSEDGRALTHLEGACRYPYTMESLKRELDLRAGIISDLTDVAKMDGMDVFSFAISKAPKSMKRLCSNFALDMASIDNLFIHQANKMIVEAVAKRMAIPFEKTPMSMREYGNTTSASIPITMVSERREELKSLRQRNLVCGFGTGLSWGSAYFETENVICPPVIEI